MCEYKCAIVLGVERYMSEVVNAKVASDMPRKQMMGIWKSNEGIAVSAGNYLA